MKLPCIIPARGGSKGIPGKNTAPLCGKPLIVWSIEAALEAETVGRVFVSTDSRAIADVAGRAGAEVIDRPAELASDTASSESALLHALGHLREREAYEAELFVFMQCTSPLTLPEDIDEAVRTAEETGADCVLAVAPSQENFLWREIGDGRVEAINHDPSFRTRRQDVEPDLVETGALYVLQTAGFLEHKRRFFGKIVQYVLPRERSMQIDEPLDLVIAEALLRERQADRAADRLPHRIGALVLDFDGVFTDNRVIVTEDGREAVLCDRSNGMGLSRLERLGIPILVISTETKPVVEARCRKLGLECVQGVKDKAAQLRDWAAEQDVALSDIVYVGNDVNDVDCLRAVGCGVAVGDAHTEATDAADIQLSSRGGRGAIREIAELILKAMKR